jgi:hypothetical protein
MRGTEDLERTEGGSSVLPSSIKFFGIVSNMISEWYDAKRLETPSSACIAFWNSRE